MSVAVSGLPGAGRNLRGRGSEGSGLHRWGAGLLPICDDPIVVRRRSFFMLFFDCFLSEFVFHFDGFCGAILAFKKDPNGSSGPSWRILAASWPLFRVIPTQKSASTRLICFC